MDNLYFVEPTNNNTNNALEIPLETSYKKQDNITRKCDKKECVNNVELHKDNYEYVSKIMFKTSCGYRNKSSNFILYHFCSKECLKHFKKYCCCNICNEDCTSDGKGTFVEVQKVEVFHTLDEQFEVDHPAKVEKLGYTLCNGRGDMEPSCISKYNLEKRFKQEYAKCGYYKIDSYVIDELCRGNDNLKQIIADNGNMVSYNMLKDMHTFLTDFEVHDRESYGITDEETFYAYYNKIKELL